MRRTALIRSSFALATIAVLLAVGIGPVAAHVEPDPDVAPRGGSAEIAFRVPNERDDADTVKVVIAFPTDHPISSVSVRTKPGWTISTEKVKLAKPLQTDDGAVSEAVSRVTWSGGKIVPGDYDDFAVSLESIPSDTDQLVFKALQTYSDGQVVRWIELTGSDGTEPDHPAPIVKLVAPSGNGSNEAPAATTAPTATQPANQAASTKALASKHDVDSAKTVGVVGIVLAVLGLLVAGVAIGLGIRKSRT